MKSPVLVLALAAAPLCAQNYELGVFLGQQQYPSLSISNPGVPGSSLKFEPDYKGVAGLRFGYSVFDFGPALLQLTAGYQLKSTSSVKVNGVNNVVSLDHSHYSLGAMANFKAMFACGIGIEYRSEKLDGTVLGHSESTTYGRPWLRANVGYAFPTPLVKPFIGLEASWALTTQNADWNSSGEDALKAMAPKLQVGLYGGLRF